MISVAFDCAELMFVHNGLALCLMRPYCFPARDNHGLFTERSWQDCGKAAGFAPLCQPASDQSKQHWQRDFRLYFQHGLNGNAQSHYSVAGSGEL